MSKKSRNKIDYFGDIVPEEEDDYNCLKASLVILLILGMLLYILCVI